MRYASVCDGIGAVHAAWLPLGWECAWHAEIEPFPASVVEYNVGGASGPNLGDITEITDAEIALHGPVELLVGGTPCQSFSVAGLRAGLADPRGNLALVYLRLAARTRARWVVWENVPGVLSSHRGWDFGAFLGALAELGYGFAYRVLDAQYVRVDGHARAVPQRRRRVFVVGRLGDWRRAAAVLFERESLRGNSPPRREARTVPAALTAHGVGTCGADDNQAQAGHLIAAWAQNSRDGVRYVGGDGGVSGALAARPGVKQQTYVAFSEWGTNVSVDGDHSATLKANSNNPGGRSCVAFHASQDPVSSSERAPCLSGNASYGVTDGLTVRRLTPLECERLQGFPDGWTRIPHRVYPDRRISTLRPEFMWDENADGTWTLVAADTPRYKALGNSMAVNCMAWLGRRIELVERLVSA